MVLKHASRGLLFATVGAAALLSACSGTDGRKMEYLQRGNEFVAQENFEKARLEYKNVLQIDPKQVDALYQLGLLEEQAQNWRAAAGNFQRVIEIDAKNVEARVHLGKLYLLSGMSDKALELAEEALRLDPKSSDVLTLKAGILAKQQKTDEAIAVVQQVLQLSPGHADATILLAGLHRIQGHPTEALELLRQGIDHNPKHLGLKFVLAEALGDQGKIGEGAQLLRDVIALKPDVLSYRLRLAAYLEAGKDYPEAEIALRDAVAHDDDQAQARLALVNFVHAHHSPEAAAKQLQEFIKQSPKTYGLQFAYAAAREREGQKRDAINTYLSIIEDEHESPAALTARSRLARIYALDGKYSDAENLISEVLKKNSTDVEALMLRAGLSLEKRDAASAVPDLRSVLRDQPDNIQALKLLAQAHVLNNKQDLAIETLHKAVALAPNDVATRLTLAELLAQQNKPAEAKHEVEAVLAHEPNHLQALEAMVKLQITDKNFNGARATAKKLSQAYPHSAVGDYMTGMVLAAQGKTSEAIAAYRTAIDKQPQAAEPLAAMVKAYLSRKQAREALAALDEALKREPSNFVAQNLRGEVLLLTGDSGNAEKALLKAVELNPKFPSSYRNLGMARLARNDVAGAVQSYESGLRQLPENEMLVYSLAALYEHQGQLDRAIGRYEELLKQKPDSDMAKNNLAMLLVTHRDDRRSLDRARDLVQKLDTDAEPAYLDTVGWVHYRRGELDQAVSVLQQVAQKVPDAPLVGYHLGMAYYTKGDTVAAQKYLEKALAAGTPFEGIDEARTTLNKLTKG